jgi:opacity protein-like surface antigen
VRPFLGAGIGVGRVSLKDHGVTGNLNVMDDTANGFAWQVMGGLGYDVTSALTLEAMVRYQSIEDAELISATGPASNIDLSATSLLLGARVSF